MNSISIQKETRTLILKINESLKKTKNLSKEEAKLKISSILNESTIDITLILDDSNNSLAQILVIDEKEDRLEPLVNSYYEILKDNSQKFYKWFLNKNNENKTILDLSVQKGNIHTINFIYEVMTRNDEQKFMFKEGENNLFHYSAINNQCYPIIFFKEKLQKFFPDISIIDIPNENGITPFLFSCYKGNKTVMDLLIDLDVNIEAKDTDGNTCLHYAVGSRNMKIIKKLLVKGANKQAMNNEGLLPIDIARQNDDDLIIEILEEKNFLTKCFSTIPTIKAIKGNRNNFSLLVIFSIIMLIKLMILNKINFYYFSYGQQEVVPYIPELICAKVNLTYVVHQYRIDDYYNEGKCLIKCGINSILLILSVFVELLIIGIAGFFLCFNKGVYQKKVSRKKMPSLIKLFETGDQVCVKCRRIMADNCIHCAICDHCVDNFDHHCFWLNTCISDKNKHQFNFFVYTTMISLILNILISIYEFCASFSFSPVFYKVLFDIGEFDKNGGKIINPKGKTVVLVMFYIVIILFFLANVYVFLIIFIPAVPLTFREGRKKGVDLSKIEDSLLDSTNRNSLFMHI